jgi:hypothetical protein
VVSTVYSQALNVIVTPTESSDHCWSSREGSSPRSCAQVARSPPGRPRCNSTRQQQQQQYDDISSISIDGGSGDSSSNKGSREAVLQSPVGNPPGGAAAPQRAFNRQPKAVRWRQNQQVVHPQPWASSVKPCRIRTPVQG